MKWIKLTQETFKDLQTEYDSGKSIVICRDYTKDFGKEYYTYFIYTHCDACGLSYLINNYDYYYSILEHPNK